MPSNAFLRELERSLPQSTVADRKVWATKIILEDISIQKLSKLLQCEAPIATRFLWLLSELGEIEPKKLFAALPYLLEKRAKINHIDTAGSFANYWLICGVPEEDEAQVVDLLFRWAQSLTANITVKSRAFLVLNKLAQKHPDLKNELKICLIDQKEKHTPDFKKKVEKLLTKLEA